MSIMFINKQNLKKRTTLYTFFFQVDGYAGLMEIVYSDFSRTKRITADRLNEYAHFISGGR